MGSGNVANMRVLGKVQVHCRYRALFTLTVQGTEQQTCKTETVLTHSENNSVKDFLKSQLPGHRGAADHRGLTMGPHHLHKRHQKQLPKDASVRSLQETPGRVSDGQSLHLSARKWFFSEIQEEEGDVPKDTNAASFGVVRVSAWSMEGTR